MQTAVAVASFLVPAAGSAQAADGDRDTTRLTLDPAGVLGPC